MTMFRTMLLGLLTLLAVAAAVPLGRADDNDQYHRDEMERYRKAMDGIWNVPSPGFARRVTYTAIAYSPSLGRQGWAKGYPTRQAAEQSAVKTCGGRDARPVIWGTSGSYIALAVGDNGAAGATGRTPAQARESALQLCRQHTTNCQVYVTLYAGD